MCSFFYIVVFIVIIFNKKKKDYPHLLQRLHIILENSIFDTFFFLVKIVVGEAV